MMKECPRCGEEVPNPVRYCPFCKFDFHGLLAVAAETNAKTQANAIKVSMVKSEIVVSEIADPRQANTTSYNKKAMRLIAILSVSFFLSLFALFVWPTLYRYDRMSRGPSVYPVRIHRITGEYQVLYPSGWSNVRGASENKNETSDALTFIAMVFVGIGIISFRFLKKQHAKADE